MMVHRNKFESLIHMLIKAKYYELQIRIQKIYTVEMTFKEHSYEK
jgi:hypothetical protein